jgi:tetratricopeptide (TPR) repeat protein
MIQQNDPPLILFYPTSPVHIRDFLEVIGTLPGWCCKAVVFNPLSRVAPGIENALREQGIESIVIDHEGHLEQKLPNAAKVLALGAVFESFALDLFLWAKQKEIAVIAIQEVAQLALNQNDINNYDAPFDHLFVASQEERRRFLALGYPSQMLSVSGLLANERFRGQRIDDGNRILKRIGIASGKKPIVYTTSPLRTRLSLHNKDDLAFREAVLTELATASARSGRRVVIKLHPNEDVEIERRRINRFVPDAIVLGRELNMDELFTGTGILVNRGNSQTCLEAVLRGVPTVVAACGLKTLFHNDGGAYVVDKISEIQEAIERADKDGPPDNSRVKANHFFLPPDGVAGFIAKELSTLVGKPQPMTETTCNWLIKSMLFVGRQDRTLRLLESIDSRTSRQDAVRVALIAHGEARVQDGIAGWHAVIALDPDWYFPHYELAHGYQASGEYHRAIDHAHKAIELHPPFHILWHEIPMRVVIMASLRSMGDTGGAIEELNSLEARRLVDIVPELLIEKAAQLSSVKGRLEDASRCLDRALNQLKTYPVNESADGQIRGRALIQVRELVEQCEQESIYPVAERLYLRILEAQPDDLSSKYRLARTRLMQRKFSKALRDLHSITRIPNGPRRIFDKILSPGATEKLDQYWPSTPRSILRPMKLAVWVGAWAIAKVIRSGFKGFADAATAPLLVAIFVVEHFFRRLSSETVKLRRTFRMLRAYLPGNSVNRYHRVKICPICGGRGTFEYQNKLTPLFRCSQCDHVYARQLPDDQVLSTLYGDVGYWEKDRMHQGITTMQESAEWDVYLKARLGILQRLDLLQPATNGSKSVFEIGCAEGMLLHALKKLGMTVAGCEMNRAVATQGVKNLGIDIRTEPFENLNLKEKNCDLVISFHTLEHMRFPENVLAKVARILRSDGSVLIEVPCGEEEYENTDHLHFFSETSLRLLLAKFFCTTEIIDNAYTNSAGVRIGSIYGVGRGVRNHSE